MRTFPASFLTWALMTVAIGLITSVGWPGFVMGAVFGLSLWMMLFFGSYATPRRGSVSARAYTTAALIAVPLGFVFFLLSGQNLAMWAPAIILVGAIFPATTSMTSETRRAR